jgi:acyl carrier protein
VVSPPAPGAEEVFGVVRDAVATVLQIPADAVHRESSFAELNADSLALIEVVEIVEEQLAPLARPGFHIDDEDLDRLRTVGEAVDYAVARL